MGTHGPSFEELVALIPAKRRKPPRRVVIEVLQGACREALASCAATRQELAARQARRILGGRSLREAALAGDADAINEALDLLIAARPDKRRELHGLWHEVSGWSRGGASCLQTVEWALEALGE